MSLPITPAHRRGCAHRQRRDVPEPSRAERRRRSTVADFPCPPGARRSGGSRRCAARRRCHDEAAGARLDVAATSLARRRRRSARSIVERRGAPAAHRPPGDRAAAVARRPQRRRRGRSTSPPRPTLDEPIAHPAHRHRARRSCTATCWSRSAATRGHRRARPHRHAPSTATVVEVVVGDGAHLTLVTVQDWDDDAVHARASTTASSGATRTVRHIVVTLGGDVVRLNTTRRYAGPGGDAELPRRLLRRRRASTSSTGSSSTTPRRTAAATSTTRARCRARARTRSGSATC